MLETLNYTITEEDDLYRRIPRKPDFLNTETGKPTSANFKPRKTDNNRLSVNIVALTTAKESVIDPQKFTVACFSAKIPLSHDLLCIQEIF